MTPLTAPIEVGRLDLGARYQGNGECQFVVWAPYAGERGVRLQIEGAPPIPMEHEGNGYYRVLSDRTPPGTRYHYLLGDEKKRSDPASRYQPDGVHGPSEVVDPYYPWGDREWKNPRLREYVIYELHTGTFSPEGTFEGVIPQLSRLKELGVTAIELMPVAQFPGNRNWGYDGVFPYAVQNSYGGPWGLKNLANAAHAEGLAVILDVVYNHLGPEGNYLRDFGPYFTSRYKTPWGDAINFDGPESDEVRRYFLENALYWIAEFHIDALRLDATHEIVDTSAQPFLRELSLAIRKRSPAYVIAENDRNDIAVVRPEGLACHAQWSDSLHHSLHVLLTGEREGYYQDFGSMEDLALAYSEAFTYSGQYSRFRRRRHGNSARGASGEQFVVCAQNHDQIGNRAAGDRLSRMVDFESLKLAAGAVLFSPYLPLLFMGEEYGDTAPFPYFTSHSDRDLIEAVTSGRRKEFAEFSWQGEVPDPQDEATFSNARLTPPEKWTGQQRVLNGFYRELLGIRKQTPALSNLSMSHCQALPLDGNALLVRRWAGNGAIFLVLHFARRPQKVAVPCQGRWTKALYSADSCWNGDGAVPATLEGDCAIELQPRSLVLYCKEVKKRP